MRDEKQCKLLPQQILLQKLNHIDIQVVGRLIQQQDIGLFQQQPRQCDTSLLPTAELLHKTLLVDFEIELL